MPETAWESFRSLSHEARHDRVLETLYNISRIIATQSDQQAMFLEVLKELEHEIGMKRGTIMLLSPDGHELQIEAALNVGERERQTVRFRRGEGVTGHVAESGQPCAIPRISEEPRFQDRIHQRPESKFEEISFICVPIQVETEVVGTLSADFPWFEDFHPLEEQKRVLSIVASMLSNDVRARRAAELSRAALEAENLRLRHQIEDQKRPENMIGSARAMREVYAAIEQVAPAGTTCLIRGESGTGKELVASAIHYASPRHDKPFIKVNCAALSETLLESELFGHEKGAFTGAVATRKGRIEEAEGGTLFLDEIGDFSLTTQVKLLRVLQEKQFERVGSNKTIAADVRILCATNRDLEKAVADGHFRQDLYYRVNVFPVHLPPLRQRRDDILQLANHFVEKYAKRMEKTVSRISTPAINMMMAYHWPGNVRELENCMERAVLVSQGGVIHGHDLPPTLQMPEGDRATPREGTFEQMLDLYAREMIVDALKVSGGNVAGAARHLGTTPRVIRYRIQRLGLDLDRLFGT